MKQYKFNEEDLERLLGEMQVGKNSYWIEPIILEWAESLEKQDFNLEIDSNALTLEEIIKKTALLKIARKSNK